MKLFLITVFASLFMLVAPVEAATVKLGWDANPVEEEVQVYNVYEKVGATFQFLKSVGTTLVTLENVTSGRHTYVVTAKNVWDVESAYSDAVSTAGGASKPSNLRIISITVP